jgi:hypothetical protein
MPNKEKNISLHPLKFEEAVELLLKVKPEKKESKKKSAKVNGTVKTKREVKSK